MKRVLGAVVVSWVAFSSQAFAQDDGDVESVQMRMDGMGPQMNMNVRVTHTRSQSGDMQGEPMMRREAPPPLPQERAMRDCGTGRDPDCEVMRGMDYPMDGETFRGLVSGLKGQDNEIERRDMAKSMLAQSRLTTRQLGVILDFFPNEIERMDVAKAAVPRLVNPKHAFGLSTKFENSIYQADFTKLITAAR